MFWCCQTLVAKPRSHDRRCLPTPRSPRMRWCQRHLCSLWCHGCTLAGYTRSWADVEAVLQASCEMVLQLAISKDMAEMGWGGRVHKKTPGYIPTSSIMWYNQSIIYNYIYIQYIYIYNIINLLSARLVTSFPKMLLVLSSAAEPTPCPWWRTSRRCVVCEST